jgi:hypothetical protein
MAKSASAAWSLIIGLAVHGCTKSNFSGDPAHKDGGAVPAKTDGPGDDAGDGPGHDDKGDDDDGPGRDDDRNDDATDDDDQPGGPDVFTEDEKAQNPKACNGANRTLVQVGQACPPSMALYTMDDMGSNDAVPQTYVCCPLPARDVLSRKADAVNVQRSRRCSSDEIMTGAVDAQGNVYCTRINTKRYALAPAKLVCGGTAGAAFGIGRQDCAGSSDLVERDTLQPVIRELLAPLGDDGCLTQPYGSLVVKQGGHKCEDSAAATLTFSADGKAVPIFP